MDVIKRARRRVQRQFDKVHRDLDLLMKEEERDEEEIEVKFKVLCDLYEALQQHDNAIFEQLTKDNAGDEEEDKEYDDMMEVKMRFEAMRVRKERMWGEKAPQAATESVKSLPVNGEGRIRNFKLPIVEIKKFSGELSDWLAWWGQFSKIHDDIHLHGSDKFWYLIQALEPGTDAHEMIVGYPQTDDNYPIAVAALTKRFGNQDLLLQVYIRQLLNLVITNASAKEKIPIKNLFLKLDAHLRALKTLELEKADPATWLFPLIETCLPEKIQDNWQRSEFSAHDGTQDDPPRTRLDLLMAFLEKEVDIKQRIDISRAFANNNQAAEKANEQRVVRTPIRKPEKRPAVPTLSSFHHAEKRSCVFCGMSNHESKQCLKAKRMSYDDRIRVLREKNLCYRCCGNHIGKNCNSTNLRCTNCEGHHLSILCREFQSKRRSGGNAEPQAKRVRFSRPQSSTPPPESSMSSASVGSSGNVTLKTLMVKVVANGREATVRAFIDDGCDRSYILSRKAKQMQLKPVGSVSAVHLLWGGHETGEVQHNKYDVELQSITPDFKLKVTLRDQDPICGRLPNVLTRFPNIRKELKEKKIELAECDDSEQDISLLIGGDLYPHLMTGQFVKLDSGPAAIKTKLGWTLLGEIIDDGERETNDAPGFSMMATENNVTRFWELEVIGIKEPAEENAIKKKEELAREEYLGSITRDPDGRYTVGLPWKDNLPLLPDNRVVAFKRLQASTNKLVQMNMYEEYDAIFHEWEKENFIERVSVEHDSAQLHYLPHRPVVKPDSLTTPVRPVFDASCRTGKSPSLNDCLFTGENYILKIMGILLRFREKRIAFISDIRKAFQMIGVNQADRDVLRFLWWSDKERKKVIEYRHARVVFGVTCSPFILSVVLFKHLTNLREEDREMGSKLLDTLYVDNCASSEDTVEQYHDFKNKAVNVMREASMELRMWQDNVENLEDEVTRVVSVLGLQWDRKEDSLFVNLKNFTIPEKTTKRTILSAVQKIFDPLGFTTPCLLPMKIMLQQTWQGKMKWDEQLPEAQDKKFRRWCREVQELEKLRIPRLSTAGVSDKKNWQLLVFSDASSAAYSGLVFLRVESEGSVSVQLLCAKSRVAPVKKMTIPKLELMGCLLGVRLLVAVKNAMNLDGVRVRYFTDSTTALAWIMRDDQWGTFVANRVKEIRKFSKAEEWSHVPGCENPADLPSRGCYPAQLIASRWWEGPRWLYQQPNEWPSKEDEANENEVLAERKRSVGANTEVTTSFSVIDRVKTSRTFASLVRVIGYARRFLHNKFAKREELKKRGPLKLDELASAERVLVREIQREAFPETERHNLTGLELLKDEWGILRVKTRLTYREELGNYRFPMLLPNQDERVKTLIRDCHRSYCHAGVGFLMTTLRKKYWIIKSRHRIRGVLLKCRRCRRYTAKPVIPEPAPLPLDRIKDAEVFEVVGVDLAGPLILKNGSKTWMVIFTCGVYRAVHFELVRKLSTAAFIKALETFSEKYRRPSIIYSDNGTNFRGADNLFKKIEWEKLERDEPTSKIEWKFNPVTSSWWGGWFERLIRTAKDLLKRTVGKGTLRWDELKACLRTVAEVMNNRPLTYVSENPDDLEPLTPALFLHPFGRASLPERELTEGESLRFRLKYVNTLRKELKERFLKEYLSMIVNRNPEKATRGLRVGELVLVGSDNLKRVEWPLARVIENIAGTDKVCRLARVKTANGEIVRSVQRLFPLEADAEVETKRLRVSEVITRSGRKVRRPVRLQ